MPYGTWGSVFHHALAVIPIEGRRRRMCRCGCRKRSTHKVCANGVALMQGCEAAAGEWAQKMSRARHSGMGAHVDACMGLLCERPSPRVSVKRYVKEDNGVIRILPHVGEKP